MCDVNSWKHKRAAEPTAYRASQFSSQAQLLLHPITKDGIWSPVLCGQGFELGAPRQGFLQSAGRQVTEEKAGLGYISEVAKVIT